MGILKPGTISLYYLGIKSDAILPLVLMTAAQTMILISGGMDLSIGGIMSLASCIAATQMGDNLISIVSISIVILFLGALAGSINGMLITKAKVQPFIITLASWTVWGGLALLILKTDGGSIFLARISGIPVSLVIVILIALLWLYFKNTVFGYAIFALGSNERAAFLNGINVDLAKIKLYSLSGLLASGAGLVYAAQIGTGSPIVGDGFILMSVAAAVIGGTSLAGGRGGIVGSIIGAAILKIISDILVFAGITSYWTPFFQGCLLILSVAIGSISMLLTSKRRAIL
jgi:ribose transport system permease protein